MARTLRAWAINRRGKNSARSLWYRPQTRVVRVIYLFFLRSERLKMDNTVTQDDDDGGKIMLLSNNLLCASRKYLYPPLVFGNFIGEQGDFICVYTCIYQVRMRYEMVDNQ